MLTGWPRPACTHVNPISGCSGVRYWSRFEAELSGVVPDCSLLRASRVHSWIAIEAWFRFNEVLLAGIVSWSRLSFLVFLIGSGGMVSVCVCGCVCFSCDHQTDHSSTGWACSESRCWQKLGNGRFLFGWRMFPIVWGQVCGFRSSQLASERWGNFAGRVSLSSLNENGSKMIFTRMLMSTASPTRWLPSPSHLSPAVCPRVLWFQRFVTQQLQ